MYVVALKLCWFLSPYIESGNENLLETTIHRAVRAYLSAANGERPRAFLNAVRDGAEMLGVLRVSARDKDDGWLIWDYEESLMDWLDEQGASAVQVTVRAQPLDAGPLVVRLMAQVCTVRDLRVAGLMVARRETA